MPSMMMMNTPTYGSNRPQEQTFFGAAPSM